MILAVKNWLHMSHEYWLFRKVYSFNGTIGFDWSGRRATSCGISGTGETPNPVAAPSPSGSNNPQRIKGKITFFSLRNICLSGLNGALPLFIQAQPRRPI
ncbi:short chain dehydrogenase [Bacillus sp. SG-1]|nr:short chain dehydrogenase [Bacillus sp. SG-1]